MFPNWVRIQQTLDRHGVAVEAARLAEVEPLARKEIDDAQAIAQPTEPVRGWRFFDLILERAGITPSEATAAALTELRSYHDAHNLWELIPDGVQGALEALRARGLTLVVVSNSNGTLPAHIKRIGLDHCFECVIDSRDEGVEKPDPRIFQIALARARAQRETTIHVGDLYQVDVVGARAAGLRGVLLDETNLHAGADCPRVRSLAELVNRIEQGAFD